MSPDSPKQKTPIAERRAKLRDWLRHRGTATITMAWEWGVALGFYVGGDAPIVKADLNAIGCRHDGFWRARTDLERSRALLWADYWSVR